MTNKEKKNIKRNLAKISKKVINAVKMFSTDRPLAKCIDNKSLNRILH